MKKSIVALFFILTTFPLIGQPVSSVYYLDDDTEIYLFGTPILVEDNTLDQPTDLYLFDSLFFVLNEFGNRLSIFNYQMEYLNTCFKTKQKNVKDLIQINDKIAYVTSDKTIRIYKIEDLLNQDFPEYTEIALNFDTTLPSFIGYTHLMHSIGGENFLLVKKFNSGNRFEILDENFQIVKGFEKIPDGLLDPNIKINLHMNIITTINKNSGNLYVGYMHTDLLEVYDIYDGSLKFIAHESNTQFPAENKVEHGIFAEAKSPFIYFSAIKVYDEKLYALYQYYVPNFPNKDSEKMNLLVFDTKNMELLQQYILDEDLRDFVVINQNELIGLCYYCENPIRQYFLD